MLTLKQRLIAHRIMFAMFKAEELKSTPFYKVVSGLLSKPEILHPAECKLLSQLMNDQVIDGQQTPSDFINSMGKNTEEDSKKVKIVKEKKKKSKNKQKIKKCSVDVLVDDYNVDGGDEAEKVYQETKYVHTC